ncbi:hypothetical protein ACFV7Q_11515 [Streptomyces sp. NPDC059851]|uniref:hypothetical protein n=1 Tax=Streptomyces sp. NPDC059851 TaxID=3346971 RepID=UPI0036479678
MGGGLVWIEPEDGPGTGDDALVALAAGAVPAEWDGEVAAGSVTCPLCGADTYEAVRGDCFCDACCIPLGIANGCDYVPDGFAWRLVPSAGPPAASGGAFVPSDAPGLRCPVGHDVFHVAVALAFGADGRARRLSAALRCPEDGALHLYVNDARVEPRNGCLRPDAGSGSGSADGAAGCGSVNTTD